MTVRVACEACGTKFSAPSRKTKFCLLHGEDRGPTYPANERVLGDGYDSVARSRRGMPVAKMVLADKVDQWLFAHDAENECVHGSLPHDRRIACTCWGAELKNSSDPLPKPRRIPVKRRKAKRKRHLKAAA